jgi:hypothetical protein
MGPRSAKAILRVPSWWCSSTPRTTRRAAPPKTSISRGWRPISRRRAPRCWAFQGPPAKHCKFIAKHGLAVPLASDAAEGGLSDALGIWTEKVNYGRTYMGMVRTTYLLGPDGTILAVWDKVKVKGHAEAVLAAARAA